MAHKFSISILLSLLFAISVSADSFKISETLISNVRQYYGADAGNRMDLWQSLMQYNLDLSEPEKLELVNSFFNHQKFISDIKHWGKEDFWATPVEFLASGGGDCEDFSIAKYFTLKQMGIPDKKLRITYVMALEYKQAHMVLSYIQAPHTEPLILDNLNKRILPASQRPDLKPVYNFNGEGLWFARQRGGGDQKAGNADRVDNWLRLKKRLQTSVKNDEVLDARHKDS